MATSQIDSTDDRAGATPQRRRIPLALATWAFVILVLLIVIVLLAVKVTRGSTAESTPPVAPAPTGVTRAVARIPQAEFDDVGAPPPTSPGAAVLTGQSPLVLGGHPAVVYVGAEFCPYCAAERWALVVALSRFGSFAHLGATASSTSEVFPGTPTFSFDGATFTSHYVTFSTVEEYGDDPSATAPGGFPLLHDPTPVEWGLVKRYDQAPFVPGSGTLPFVDVANRFLVSGAGIGFSPGVFQGKSMAQIAGDLSDPLLADTQSVLGEANLLSAEICAVTAESPQAVCRSAGVEAGARQLGLAVRS
jgi:hypothetical protein